MTMLAHIGYPKCGSTWLQTHLFPQLNGGEGYEKPGGNLLYSPPMNVFGSMERKYVYPGHFDPTKAIERLKEQPLSVISNEVWAGHPFSGGVHFREYAQRLKQIVPQAKILIVVREQRRMILSTYAHFVEKSSHKASLRQFLAAPKQTHVPSASPHYFCYHHLVREYRDLFEHVLVLPFELLTKLGPSNFCSPIYEFLGLDQPAEYPASGASNQRDYRAYVLRSRFGLLRSLSDRSRLISKGAKASSVFVSDRLVKRVMKEDLDIIEDYFRPYASTNNALQDFVSANLAELGYMTE